MERGIMAEQALVGAMMLDPEGSAQAAALCSPVMFEDEGMQILFRVIRELQIHKKPVDVVGVLGGAGEKYKVQLVEACETCPSVSNAGLYAQLVLEGYRRRMLLGDLAKAQFDLSDVVGSVDQVMAQVRRALDKQQVLQELKEDESARDLEACIAEFEKELAQPDEAYKTGWLDLDEYGLFQPGSVVVLSGRPGTGKTDLALNLLARLSGRYRVNYNTLEMPRTQLMLRLTAKATRIPSTRLARRELSDTERSSIHNLLVMMAEQRTLILDEAQGVTPELVEARILKYQPQLIALDHVGLMRTSRPRDKAVERLTEISNALKQLALRHRCCIVEVVQMKRDVDRRGPDSVELADLKGTGAFEEDADAVVQIRPKAEEGENGTKTVTLYVKKNRHGPQGEICFSWEPAYHSWVPLSYTQQDCRPVPGGFPGKEEKKA